MFMSSLWLWPWADKLALCQQSWPMDVCAPFYPLT